MVSTVHDVTSWSVCIRKMTLGLLFELSWLMFKSISLCLFGGMISILERSNLLWDHPWRIQQMGWCLAFFLEDLQLCIVLPCLLQTKLISRIRVTFCLTAALLHQTTYLIRDKKIRFYLWQKQLLVATALRPSVGAKKNRFRSFDR